MALDFLSDDELSLIRSDFSDLVQDPQVGGTVLYNSFVSTGSFDPTSGQVSETYAGTWIHVFRQPFDELEMEERRSISMAPPERYQVGTYHYLIAAAEVGLPKKDDRIVDGGSTRYVVSFITDVLGVFHSIEARNLGTS